MRVGMHEMHALRVRGFFHGNDRGNRQITQKREVPHEN